MLHSDPKNPFKYYDPRSLPAYKDLLVPDAAVIPTTDEGAWEHFPRFRWAYNKLEVALSQNILAAPVGILPKKFPVFLKPITNLFGMGVGAKMLSSEIEYEKNKHLSGYFWMEYLEGEHLSHDLIVRKGEVLFHLTFLGHSLGKGMFDFWEVTQRDRPLNYAIHWASKHLPEYTGCINIETIGGKIIDCHLRMGDIDRLCNKELMQSIVDLYSLGKWQFSLMPPPFFIFPLWGERNVAYTIDTNLAQDICKRLTCYAIEDPELYYQNPIGGVRIAVACGYDREECIRARQLLYEKFIPRPRKPK